MKNIDNYFINNVKNAFFLVLLGMGFCILGSEIFKWIGFVLICLGVLAGVCTNLDEGEDEDEKVKNKENSNNSEKAESIQPNDNIKN